MSTTIYVLSKNKKNIKIFLLKIIIFYNLKNLCILHGHVFVMNCTTLLISHNWLHISLDRGRLPVMLTVPEVQGYVTPAHHPSKGQGHQLQLTEVGCPGSASTYPII